MKLRRRSTSDDFKGFLDQGTSLTGELQFSGTLRVDGNIHGSVTTSDLLIVGERAMVHADIRAGDVQIFGSVLGNVNARRRVEIYATGCLRGDVRTPQLVIEEGGTFEGVSRPASESSELPDEPSESDGAPFASDAVSESDAKWSDGVAS